MKKTELSIEKGRRLKESILKKYHSQVEFANHVTEKGYYNLYTQNLCAMIKGERNISKEFVHAIAGLLEVSEEYLMCQTDIPTIFDDDTKNYVFTDDVIFNTSDNDYILRLITKLIERKKHTPVFFNVISFKNHKAYKRRRCTIDNLENLAIYCSSCIYRDEHIKSEVVVDYVEVGNKKISYGEYYSLASIGANLIPTLFDHTSDLNIFRMIENEKEDYNLS